MLKLHLSRDLGDTSHKVLFWACYLAFATTSFIFIVRTQIINDLGLEFALSETQKGEILGAGIWPLAISIVLFSMVIDDIGYGKSMAFGFCCQVVSGIVMLQARGYWGLYIGSFLVSLGNGAVQAVSDATVATMFKQNKTKWLNVFHSGWPMGMIIGGPLGVLLTRVGLGWRWNIGMLFVPIAVYAIAMVGKKFPVHERVAAGIPYREMLRESGAIGMLIALLLVCGEICRVFALPPYVAFMIAGGASFVYFLYVRAPGKPVFIILLLLMIPLSTTEISTNTWITSLMEHELAPLGVNSSWVLIYASVIMVILRFSAGPIVKLFSPLGLLAVSSLFAAAGLAVYSQVTGLAVFLAATLFGIGTTFLWPTMLGVTAERFPRGGALSLNMVTAVGQLSAGIMGTALLGHVQDTTVARQLQARDAALYAQVTVQRESLIGTYNAVDSARLEGIEAEQWTLLDEIRHSARKTALLKEALLPLVMFVSFVLLILHFRRKGGYQAISIRKQ